MQLINPVGKKENKYWLGLTGETSNLDKNAPVLSLVIISAIESIVNEKPKVAIAGAKLSILKISTPCA